MASAEQLKALIKSHLDGDDSHFYAIAMQVAAHEAKLGYAAYWLSPSMKQTIPSTIPCATRSARWVRM